MTTELAAAATELLLKRAETEGLGVLEMPELSSVTKDELVSRVILLEHAVHHLTRSVKTILNQYGTQKL